MWVKAAFLLHTKVLRNKAMLSNKSSSHALRQILFLPNKRLSDILLGWAFKHRFALFALRRKTNKVSKASENGLALPHNLWVTNEFKSERIKWRNKECRLYRQLERMLWTINNANYEPEYRSETTSKKFKPILFFIMKTVSSSQSPELKTIFGKSQFLNLERNPGAF